jgi:hypothetical protein
MAENQNPPKANTIQKIPVAPKKTPPASADSGPCPNATTWAFDPVANKCVAIRACPTGQVYNPDESKCIPQPPGGGLECLKGWVYDRKANRCVPPNCSAPFVFSTAENKCLPPAPIVCPAGSAYDTGQKKCVAQETYRFVSATIVTGSDDLRDSATLEMTWGPKGYLNCTLKDLSSDNWANNSTHVVPCDASNDTGLLPTLAELKSAKISISYIGNPKSLGQTQDNWNLESITLNAYNQGETPVCVFSTGGDPLFRFKGDSPSVVISNYPNQCQ